MSGQSAREVYLVGWSQACPTVLEYDGMLKALTSCATLSYETTCIFSPSPGLAYIGGGGTQQMARFSMSTFTPESFQLPQSWIESTRLQFLVNGIGQVDGKLFAVGSFHMIFEKTGPTTWTPVHSPAIAQNDLGNEATLYAVAGAGAEGYAVGTAGSGDSEMLRYTGGTWTDAQYVGHDMLDTVWAASPDLYFAGGDSNGTGVILMGRR
jgi:hypothetical protein